MDTELHFQWPDGTGHTPDIPPPSKPGPLARRRRGQSPEPSAQDADAVAVALEEALAHIARLERDRTVARQRIEQLEAARDDLRERVTAQRRRLLVLERQLEDAGVEPAREAPTSATWLDRLFGGLSPVGT